MVGGGARLRYAVVAVLRRLAFVVVVAERVLGYVVVSAAGVLMIAAARARRFPRMAGN